MAVVLANLGTVQTRLGEWSKAEKNLKRALKIRKGKSGPNSLELLAILDSLAYIYVAQSWRLDVYVSGDGMQLGYTNPFNRADDAENTLKRVIAIRFQHLGPEHPDVLTSLDRLGNLYRQIERPEDAIEVFSRTLAIRERQNDQSDAWLGNVLKLADELFYKSRFAEAEPLLVRGLKELEARKPNSTAHVVAMCYLGETYRRRRNYTAAEQVFQASLARFSDDAEGSHLKVWVMRRDVLLLWATKRGRESREMRSRPRALLSDEFEVSLTRLERWNNW